MKRLAPLLIIALASAACGGKSSGAKGGAATASCPAAESVVAVYLGAEGDGEGAKSAWMLNLHRQDAAEDTTESSFKKITAEEAKAKGAVIPAGVWMYAKDQPPCRATPGAYFEMIGGEEGYEDIIGVELEGCATPAKDQPGLIYSLIGDGDLSGCRYAEAPLVASRVGTDDGEKWAAPTTETPVPAALAGSLKQVKCAAPCEALYSVTAASVDGAPVAYQAIQTWLHDGPEQSECEMEHEDETSIFSVGKGGTPIKADLTDVYGALAGVFYDASGPRLMLVENAGDYDVFTYQPDGAVKHALHAVYQRVNEESNVYLSMAPYCGP